MAASDTTFTFTITAKQKKVVEIVEENILEHLKKVCESRMNKLDIQAKEYVSSQSDPVATYDEVMASGIKSALDRRLDAEAATEALRLEREAGAAAAAAPEEEVVEEPTA